ncbi:hypothetical protein KUW09_25065 [Mameliella alba]|nr:hypothetical protein [Antarctobacter heliothermus]MBY6147334.1 hypothetical protein [Mameliella alba]MCA0957388.1 hypothetical protein [Mameliella alba]
MPNLYDDIMRLLHDAGEFADAEEQKKVARAARHAHQIAETELLIDSARQHSSAPL